jgi:hypothetical protein
MQLRQPSQKAWPHTRMRGTTPSLRHTASQSQNAPAGGSYDSKTATVVYLVLLITPS